MLSSEKISLIISGAFSRHTELFEQSEKRILPDVERGAGLLIEAAERRRRLFICGNGGSAAQSQHFAAEWLCRYRDDRGPLPAIALTTDSSVLTAIGNDYSFEDIFSRQIEALGVSGDVLVAITTSGKSRNILKAIGVAKAKAMRIIVLTGEGGKELASGVDCAVVVPGMETARIQEIHEFIIHAWCECVDASLRSA